MNQQRLSASVRATNHGQLRRPRPTRQFLHHFQRLVDYSDEYQVGARRFDVGEPPNFALMPMFSAALDLLLEWTPETIQSTLSEYTGQLESALRELELITQSVPARAGHFLGFRFP